MWGNSVRVKELSWLVSRLRVMSLAEILHRVKEQLFHVYLQLIYKCKKNYSQKDCLVSKFSFCTSKKNKLPILSWNFEPTSLEATQWLAGAWPALNYSWHWKKGSNCWNIAPDSREEWPSAFFNSINYRPGNSNGDVRIAWEPSRLQQLIALSLVSQHPKFNASDAAVDLIEAQLRDWLESNKYLSGIHYISSMECALRIISVCYSLDIARNYVKSNSLVWNDLLNIVESHASLIEKRLSLYSSSGNHTIAEAVGLLYAGINFPEFKRADVWKRKALTLLRHEADRQILRDGGSIEQSFWYLLFVCDLYGLADKLLQHVQETDQKISSAFKRASEFLSAFANCPDRIPDIGDSDNGYALSKFLRISFNGDQKKIVSRTYENSGYTLCNPIGNIKLILDHGQLGMAPLFGHGHADCLSLLMFSGQREIITDCGTYGYAVSPEWRKFFRGTAAHNTVSVDGYDQADHINSFMWKDAYQANLLFSEEIDNGLYLLACHNGYESLGVTHWRGIFVDSENGCFVWDRLVGTGNHNLMLRWHVADVISRDGNSFSIDVEQKIDLTIDNAHEIIVHRGNLNPIMGWKSNGYGEKIPVSTVEAEYYGELPHEFHTNVLWGRDAVIKNDDINFAIEKFREAISDS